MPRRNRKRHGAVPKAFSDSYSTVEITEDLSEESVDDAPHDDEDYSDTNDEPRAQYRPGGYHPVSEGELYDGRYRVIRKLGWGYFSTVWLCWDYDKPQPDACPPLDARCRESHATLALYSNEGFEFPPAVDAPCGGRQRGGWAAVKFQKSAKTYREVAMDEIALLSGIARAADVMPIPSSQHPVCSLYHHFMIRGPHGKHVCMVFDVLGENLLRPIISTNYVGLAAAWKDGMAAVKRATAELLRGLDVSHRLAGIIHTDVKPENVLVRAPHSAAASMMRTFLPPNNRNAPVQLVETHAAAPSTLSKSQRRRLRRKRAQGKLPPADAAESAHGATPLEVQHRALTAAEVAVADFGNACWVNKRFNDEVQTRQYRAPEVLLGEFLFDPSSRDGTPYDREDDHLALMIELLGRFPDSIASAQADVDADAIPPQPIAYWLRESDKIDEGADVYRPPAGSDAVAAAACEDPPEDLLPLCVTDAPFDGVDRKGLSAGRFRRARFRSDGTLRNVDDLRFWDLTSVLQSKYGFVSRAALEVTSFLLPMLHPDPRSRPSARQMLRHPWLVVRPEDENGSCITPERLVAVHSMMHRDKSDPQAPMPELPEQAVVDHAKIVHAADSAPMPWWVRSHWMPDIRGMHVKGRYARELRGQPAEAFGFGPEFVIDAAPVIQLPYAPEDPLWVSTFHSMVCEAAVRMGMRPPAPPQDGIYTDRKVSSLCAVYGVSVDNVLVEQPMGTAAGGGMHVVADEEGTTTATETASDSEWSDESTAGDATPSSRPSAALSYAEYHAMQTRVAAAAAAQGAADVEGDRGLASGLSYLQSQHTGEQVEAQRELLTLIQQLIAENRHEEAAAIALRTRMLEHIGEHMVHDYNPAIGEPEEGEDHGASPWYEMTRADPYDADEEATPVRPTDTSEAVTPVVA